MTRKQRGGERFEKRSLSTAGHATLSSHALLEKKRATWIPISRSKLKGQISNSVSSSFPHVSLFSLSLFSTSSPSPVPHFADCSLCKLTVLPAFIRCCQFIKSEISPLEFQLRGFKVSGSVVEGVIKQAGCFSITGLRGLSRPLLKRPDRCKTPANSQQPNDSSIGTPSLLELSKVTVSKMNSIVHSTFLFSIIYFLFC